MSYQNQDVKNLENENIMATYGRYPVAIERGKGATLYDFEGNKYIDFTSGIGVTSLGQCDEEWVKAVSEQASTLVHMSNLFTTLPAGLLAEKLCALSGMSRVFFANSGAEANEGAIKLARKYSFDKYGSGRSTIITLVNSFHGRTVTTLSATGQDVFHNFFFPFTEGFKHVAANDLKALKEALDDTVCAVMIEPVQGEGGVLALDTSYIQAAAKLCKGKDVLLIFDEVQTGIARTGSLFAFGWTGVTPDILTLAKGLGGGLPIGALLCGDGLKDVLGAGQHATTFGGNPVVCAGALKVLERVSKKEFLDEVNRKGELIRRAVEGFNLPMITEVRGRGLMLGIAVEGKDPKKLVAKMTGEGLLCLTAGKDAIRLLPPLNITDGELEEGLAIMKKVLIEQSAGQ
jgi:acetylornithine/N-succinyldiaminopimelate aminotransferase